MAGNIPLVGFHDFMSVLISGHSFAGKPSSRDTILLKTISEILIRIKPEFESRIHLSRNNLADCKGIIATGSNNTYRYFEHYFGKRPHIFRKNRNGIAIFSGTETPDQLRGLAEDVFVYFGLGCRNVSKIYIPAGYDFTGMMEAFEPYRHLADHHKYANNYNYQKAILEMSSTPYIDNGFLILQEHTAISSPVGTLYYEYFSSKEDLASLIGEKTEEIQCTVSGTDFTPDALPVGTSQRPELNEYADNMDTILFLINLGKKQPCDI